MKNIIIDTGFWFALFDSTDQYHSQAMEMYELINGNNIIIPFPTFYETINTEFSSEIIWMTQFENIIKESSVTKLYDEQYRDDALNYSFYTSIKQGRNLSLTDIIIRFILDDPNVKIDYLVTFNEKDFIDVCSRKGIEFLQNYI